ncbi:hypothetical protein [Nesterenkonia sp. DZ6]|uniref:hypothetical protein n=1 Tax=Nesterenkonia sp. DZ6 TaxID=2901229 RepID=UPI001F4C6D40|nr:hypothetical protein [Nesterenkonia sp. DZ6]MCH8561101.1 hypothetical protein [Nesterenkonia sp. DZ6]
MMPHLLENSLNGKIVLRGYVGVAGRTNRLQKSSWTRRWHIQRGEYTAVEGSPTFTPIAVLWREIYLRLPERASDESVRHPSSGVAITRGLAHSTIDEAMSRFERRPAPEELQSALAEIAEGRGDRFPMIGHYVSGGYEALDRMEGHLTDWTDGLRHRSRRQKRLKKEVERDDAD